MAKKDLKNKPIIGEASAAGSSLSFSGFGDALGPDHPGKNNRASYPSLLRDDQVYACFQQRRLSVISAKWSVEPGGNAAEDKRAAEALERNLHALLFDNICDRMLYGVFYGRGVAEIIWEVEDGLVRIADIRPRDPFRFHFDKKGRLLLEQDVSGGKVMPSKKFWLLYPPQTLPGLGGDTGLAHYLYWPVYIKRHILQFWAVFSEKFSTPSVKGRFPAAATEEEKEKLLQACSALGSEAAVVIPDGMEMDLVEATRRGGGDYQEFHSALNQAISKVILSQTMTTDDGSSRAQATVHETVRDKLIKSDADLLCESFNRSAVKWWCEWNFPAAQPPRVLRRMKEADDLDARVTRDSTLMNHGYHPDDEYIKRHYGDGWTKGEAVPRSKPIFAANSKLTSDSWPTRNVDELPPEWVKLADDKVNDLRRLAKDSKSLQEFAERLAEIKGVTAEDVTELAVGLFAARIDGSERGD